MVITVTPTTIAANAVTTVTVTVPDEAVFAELWSENNKIKLSLDNTAFSDFVMLERGTQTVYVRCGNLYSGLYSTDFGYWYYASGQDSGNEYISITVTGGMPHNFENISMALAPRNTTVQYNLNASSDAIAVKDTIAGSILDHNYEFEVEKVTETGLKRAVSGATEAEMLVHALITYWVDYHFDWSLLGWEIPKFSDHINALENAVGLPIVFQGDDFYPATTVNYLRFKNFGLSQMFTGSFGEHLSRLIGWTDSVPNMVYNLYIENGTVYIVERGHELNTRTPTNWALRPTLTHTIRRTQWAESQYQTVVPKEISSSDNADNNEPFSGTITWGTASLTYEDGYLTQEIDGNRTTVYQYSDYDDGKRLASKTSTDTQLGTEVVTTYTYQASGNDMYLSEEVMEKYSNGGLIDRTRTTHVPIGNGWYGTSTFDYYDNEVSTSLSQGAPGNKASQYTINAANDAVKPQNTPGQQGTTVELRGVAKARQTYPVSDLNTLRKIANALDLYEGREEITLQGELVGGDHVYNYNDKIVFEGNTYYLVANNVSQTGRTIRQQITAVRWILPST